MAGTDGMGRLLRLDGRCGMITGSGSGIGRETALLAARQGAAAGLLSRDPDEIGELVGEIEEAGGTAMSIPGDISKPEKMDEAYRSLIDKWGRLDFVVANAGVNGVWAPIEQLEPDEFQKTVEINLVGTFLTIKYAVPYLKRQGGSVVIVSSINGTRVFSNSGATAYSSTKAAQVAMAKMLALELASERIRVNVICPGAISTSIGENTERRHLEEAREPAEYPAGKVPLTDGEPGTAEEVAHLILFLLSDASRHISGTEMWIDGAQSLLQG